MDYITGLKRALDYIEENICDNLDYNIIANKALCSSFYFQRIFSVLCGVTLGEYIRNRRLTLAGSELVNTDEKILDIALKYGYDSPESFSRAFFKFHGQTPSNARKSGKNLKSFSRLSVKIIMNGGKSMNYRIIEKPSFTVLEKMEIQSTKNEENKLSIPDFWTRVSNDGTLDYLIKTAINKDFVFGICYESKEKNSESFEYSIGVMCDKNCKANAKFRVKEIPARTWAIFECIGSMPEAIQKTWHDIYAEFLPTSGYTTTEEMDIEVYFNGDMSSPDYKSQIWIPIKK